MRARCDDAPGPRRCRPAARVHREGNSRGGDRTATQGPEQPRGGIHETCGGTMITGGSSAARTMLLLRSVEKVSTAGPGLRGPENAMVMRWRGNPPLQEDPHSGARGGTGPGRREGQGMWCRKGRHSTGAFPAMTGRWFRIRILVPRPGSAHETLRFRQGVIGACRVGIVAPPTGQKPLAHLPQPPLLSGIIELARHLPPVLEEGAACTG